MGVFKYYMGSIQTAVKISRTMMAATPSNVEATTKSLQAIARTDEVLIEQCRKESQVYPATETWMMLNVVLVVGCMWPWLDGFMRVAVSVASVINLFCLYYKQKTINLTPALFLTYWNLHAQFLSALAVPCAGLLVYNVALWATAGWLSRALLAYCPSALAGVLGADMNPLGAWVVWIALRWTFLRKSLLTCEVLYNHAFYIKALKTKAKKDLSFTGHVVDALYASTYSAVANTCAVTSLGLLNWAAAACGMPASPLALLLGCLLRAPFGMNCGNIRLIMYFASHRIFHRFRPLYLLYHREHHYPLHQTCLGASQESGMVEAPVEAIFVAMCYTWVPHLDMLDWILDNHVNEFFHHYYEEYRQTYWVVVLWLTWLQGQTRGIFGRLACVEQPLGCDNLMYEHEDPQTVEGAPIAESWHGKHHWTTHQHFGYGTFDSLLNNAQSEESITKIVHAYLALVGKSAPAEAKKVQ